MNLKDESIMKIGGAVMAVGTAAAAAVALGVAKMTSPKHKMKKLAKKSIKAVDGVLNNVNHMFK